MLKKLFIELMTSIAKHELNFKEKTSLISDISRADSLEVNLCSEIQEEMFALNKITLRATNCLKKSSNRWLSSSVAQSKKTLHPIQEKSMKEQCFLVDMNDKVIGTASKRECHLVQDDGQIPLHRAFSVLLFNNAGEIVLQKRSSQKITFPDLYTNTCCSHPLADIPGEEVETEALGVKRAAQRRLNHELGIPISSIPIENFFYLTRIYYKDAGDGEWGEHEIDYILILRGDLSISPNPDEVAAVHCVSKDNFNAFSNTLAESFTPWFAFMLKHHLPLWWDNLNDLKQFVDHKNIQK